MKKHLLFKFLLALFLFAGWQSSFGQEIIDNWAEDGGSITYAKNTSEFHGGSTSIEITWTSTSNQYLNSDAFAVTEGQAVVASLWALDNDAAGRTRLCINYDSGTDYFGSYSSDDANWQEITASTTVPADATSAQFQIRFYDVSPFDGDATISLDDVSLTLDGGSNVILNPGFETWTVQPIISNIVTDPAVVKATDAVSVSAEVDPNTTTVNSVDLNWGTSSGSLGTTISMTNTSGNTWTTSSDIPAQTTGTTVYYEVEVTYNTTETTTSDEQSYEVVTVTNVSDIATLRAGATDGTIYKLTGEAVLTFDAGGSRNQKFIEDATGGILIDDANGTITTSYTVEDGITGIFGTLSLYNGILQFVIKADPGAATAGWTITPQEITIDGFNTNYTDYESEIIKFVDVNFEGADGTGTFNDDTDYTLGDGSNTTTFRYGWAYSLDYQGNTMPHESIDVTLVGIGARYNTTPQFYCRDAADMTIPDYIVITSPADNTTFDTETDIVVDFVTYNQTDLLKLQVWIPDPGSWEDVVTNIDPATETTTASIPADAEEASTYKLRLLDQTDSDPISNEVPFAINDVSGPVWNSYNPADGSSDVAKNQNLIIDFHEDVKAGTGNIIIKKYDDDNEIASYDVTTAPEINITDNVVTITNASDWPNITKLYVEIAAGVIVDMQDNEEFSVVKDDWDFTTADEVAPQATFSPLDAATGIARNTAITISFDEAIYTMAGGSTPFDDATIDALITFKLTNDAGADVPFDATINVTNNVITIAPVTTPLDGSTVYYYAISNLYEDDWGNQGSAGNATFTTIDESAPVVTITPANSSTDIERDTTIAIEFDKAVRKLDDSEVVDGDLAAMITLKETDAAGADVAFTATINAEKDSISVVPDANLKANQLYYVAISADLESNTGAPIAATNVTFTTIDDEAPIATFDPADAETDVAINSDIVITFNEAILNTDASAIDDANVDALITLKETDASGTDLSFDATIDVNKKIITIVPAADFDYNQTVYVSVAAVEDAAGNESALQSATFTSILNDDATLSDLTVDATTVDGFAPATYDYNVELPYGTTVVPTVAATENDPDANAVVTQATNLDGTEAERTATVVVTAEDGTTELTYSIVFSIGHEGGLFFSEYIEGDGGNNKALEIYNPTDAEVDLSNYVLRGSANDATGWEYLYIFPDGATIAAKDVYVIVDDGADAALQDVADWSAEYAATVTGNDARGLFKIAGSDTTLIDIIGNPNNPDGTDFDVAGITGAAANHTLIRKPGIIEGNTDWTTSSGTNADDSEWEVHDANYFDDLGSHSTSLSSDAEILTFVLAEQTEPATIGTNTIDITVLSGTDASALTPTITVSDGAEISPVSGLEQNFTSPVVYTVTAEDESTKDWTVTVTVSSTLSDQADITKITVSGADSTKINSVDTTIVIYAPYGFDVASVKPIFEISAGAAIADTATARDFATAQTYEVTAQDGTTTKDWEVTVEVQEVTELTIYDIQYTTDASGDSPYLGELIQTSGIVTAISGSNLWIQDGDGVWNGVMIYSSATADAVTIGDDIEFVAEVDEYYGLTELLDVSNLEILSTGNAAPAATTIAVDNAITEGFESVIIKIDTIEVTTVGGSNKIIYTASNGSATIYVDENLYAQTGMVAGDKFGITGIGNYSYDNFRISPRSADDIAEIEDPGTGIVELEESYKIYPNPSNGLFKLEINNTNNEEFFVEIYDIIGKMVYNTKISDNITNINITEMSAGIYYVSIKNGDNRKVSKIIIQ